MTNTTDAPGVRPRIDPELRRSALLYRRVDHRDPLAVRREAARRILVARKAGMWLGTDPDVRFEDVRLPSGEAGVPVRIYRPVRADVLLPAVLYLHGGAFLSGDLDFEHPRCLQLCRETGFAVVAVDYRLAPEHRFPAALDDCVAAYLWLRSGTARETGIDTDRVAVAGTSAGGALAAAVSLWARDFERPAPRLQMLMFPVTDDRLATPSMRAFDDTPVWDARNCAPMWDHYLGPLPPGETVSPYAAPARARDLSGLPPAYVMTAELDPLRDEGADYARRLAEAGVPTELHQFPGTFHGFDTLATAPVSLRARREQHDVLRAALA